MHPSPMQLMTTHFPSSPPQTARPLWFPRLQRTTNRMHIHFWSTLENHKWRHWRNKNQQCALLVYQGQQCHRWHNCVTSPRAFDLSLINDNVLQDTLDTILLQTCSNQTEVISV
jgi:hypothetical protein